MKNFLFTLLLCKSLICIGQTTPTSYQSGIALDIMQRLISSYKLNVDKVSFDGYFNFQTREIKLTTGYGGGFIKFGKSFFDTSALEILQDSFAVKYPSTNIRVFDFKKKDTFYRSDLVYDAFSKSKNGDYVYTEISSPIDGWESIEIVKQSNILNRYGYDFNPQIKYVGDKLIIPVFLAFGGKSQAQVHKNLLFTYKIIEVGSGKGINIIFLNMEQID